jgi:hypothetical protein
VVRAQKFPSRNFPLSSRKELPRKFLGSSEAFLAIWKLPSKACGELIGTSQEVVEAAMALAIQK